MAAGPIAERNQGKHFPPKSVLAMKRCESVGLFEFSLFLLENEYRINKIYYLIDYLIICKNNGTK